MVVLQICTWIENETISIIFVKCVQKKKDVLIVLGQIYDRKAGQVASLAKENAA